MPKKGKGTGKRAAPGLSQTQRDEMAQISREEFLMRAAAAFDDLDHDSSGGISEQEFGSLVSGLGQGLQSKGFEGIVSAHTIHSPPLLVLSSGMSYAYRSRSRSRSTRLLSRYVRLGHGWQWRHQPA